jgi:hypothetical protein
LEPQKLVEFLNDHYSNVKKEVEYIRIYPDTSSTANRLLFEVVEEAPISERKDFSDEGTEELLAYDNQDLEKLGEEFKEHFPGSEYEKISDDEMKLIL